MRKLALFLSGLSLAAFASTAHAGGPVVIQDEGDPVVVTGKPGSKAGIIVPLLLLLVVGAALSGGDDSNNEQMPGGGE